MPRLTTHVMTLFLVLAVAGCGGSSTSPTTTSSAPYSQTDLVAGFGAEATAGRTVTVSYAGWLYDYEPAGRQGQSVRGETPTSRS